MSTPTRSVTLERGGEAPTDYQTKSKRRRPQTGSRPAWGYMARAVVAKATTETDTKPVGRTNPGHGLYAYTNRSRGDDPRLLVLYCDADFDDWPDEAA